MYVERYYSSRTNLPFPENLNYDHRDECIEALKALGSPQAIPYLEEMKEKESEVRYKEKIQDAIDYLSSVQTDE